MKCSLTRDHAEPSISSGSSTASNSSVGEGSTEDRHPAQEITVLRGKAVDTGRHQGLDRVREGEHATGRARSDHELGEKQGVPGRTFGQQLDVV